MPRKNRGPQKAYAAYQKASVQAKCPDCGERQPIEWMGPCEACGSIVCGDCIDVIKYSDVDICKKCLEEKV